MGGLNTGHGHVRPRPDGPKARCGGPAICSECAREQAQQQSTATFVYIVITKDRHADAETQPFTEETDAIAHAEREVEENVRHPELIEPEDRELTDGMLQDGWVWYCRYGIEGDSVRVVRRELR